MIEFFIVFGFYEKYVNGFVGIVIDEYIFFINMGDNFIDVFMEYYEIFIIEVSGRLINEIGY